MMNRIVLISLVIFSYLFAENATAQTIQQIATINSVELLDALPEKVDASKIITDLSNRYKDELQVMQNDYNKKYSDFISYQSTMAEAVRLRRMQELHELEKSINEFMKIAQNDIDSQENLLIAPLKKRVKDAIREVGVEHGYICIYDLANPALAFVTPDATNATPLVKHKLGIREERKAIK